VSGNLNLRASGDGSVSIEVIKKGPRCVLVRLGAVVWTRSRLGRRRYRLGRRHRTSSNGMLPVYTQQGQSNGVGVMMMMIEHTHDMSRRVERRHKIKPGKKMGVSQNQIDASLVAASERGGGGRPHATTGLE
jgi:hypothetical protein